MKINKKLKEAIDSSPVFADMTERLNVMVDKANHDGLIIPDDLISELNNIRILMTLKNDPKVYSLLSATVYKEIQAKQC